MPFKSQAQRRWMFRERPQMARRWARHTPRGARLPERVKSASTGVVRMGIGGWHGAGQHVVRIGNGEDSVDIDVKKLAKSVRDKRPITIRIADVKGFRPAQAKRAQVRAAETKYPVLITSDRWLLDGNHRLTKLHEAGETRARAVIVPYSTIRRAVTQGKLFKFSAPARMALDPPTRLLSLRFRDRRGLLEFVDSWRRRSAGLTWRIRVPELRVVVKVSGSRPERDLMAMLRRSAEAAGAEVLAETALSANVDDEAMGSVRRAANGDRVRRGGYACGMREWQDITGWLTPTGTWLRALPSGEAGSHVKTFNNHAALRGHEKISEVGEGVMRGYSHLSSGNTGVEVECLAEKVPVVEAWLRRFRNPGERVRLVTYGADGRRTGGKTVEMAHYAGRPTRAYFQSEDAAHRFMSLIYAHQEAHGEQLTIKNMQIQRTPSGWEALVYAAGAESVLRKLATKAGGAVGRDASMAMHPSRRPLHVRARYASPDDARDAMDHFERLLRGRATLTLGPTLSEIGVHATMPDAPPGARRRGLHDHANFLAFLEHQVGVTGGRVVGRSVDSTVSNSFGRAVACGPHWRVLGSKTVRSIPQEYDDGTVRRVRVNVSTVDVGHLNNDGSTDVCRITRTRHGIGFTWPDGHKESSRPDAQFWPWLAAKCGADLAAEVRSLLGPPAGMSAVACGPGWRPSSNADEPVRTKRDVVRAISDQLRVTQTAAAPVVQAALDQIAEVLIQRGRVELRNFGVFELVARSARRTVDPSRGHERMDLPARVAVRFRPSQRIVQRLRTGHVGMSGDPTWRCDFGSKEEAKAFYQFLLQDPGYRTIVGPVEVHLSADGRLNIAPQSVNFPPGGYKFLTRKLEEWDGRHGGGGHGPTSPARSPSGGAAKRHVPASLAQRDPAAGLVYTWFKDMQSAHAFLSAMKREYAGWGVRYRYQVPREPVIVFPHKPYGDSVDMHARDIDNLAKKHGGRVIHVRKPSAENSFSLAAVAMSLAAPLGGRFSFG